MKLFVNFMCGIRIDDENDYLLLYFNDNAEWLLFDGSSSLVASWIGDSIRDSLEQFFTEPFAQDEWDAEVARIEKQVTKAVAGTGGGELVPDAQVGHLEAGIMQSVGWPVYEADGEWFVGEKSEEA